MPPFPPADIAKIQAQRAALVKAAQEGEDLNRVVSDSYEGGFPFQVGVVPFDTGNALIVPGRMIVRAKDVDQVQSILDGAGFSPSTDSCLSELGLARLDSENPSDAMVNFTRAIRNSGLDASLDPILPLNPWTMKGTGGAEPTERRIGRRPRSKAGAGIRVAVIDSGIQRFTTDEAGRTGRTDGWLDGIAQTAENTDLLSAVNQRLGRFLYAATGPAYLDASAGHGTFVSGIIRRVAPAARVRVYRAFNSEGVANDLSVACAILQAKHDGVDVINLSLGTEALDGSPPLATATAIASLPKRVAVVAAAGNTGSATTVFPAAIPRVIAVSALDRLGKKRALFATTGPWVDVSTIGEGVVSTYVDGVEWPQFDPNLPDSWSGRNPIAMWSGTSFAAPQIAGLIARRARAAGSPMAAWSAIRRSFARTAVTGLGVRVPVLRR